MLCFQCCKLSQQNCAYLPRRLAELIIYLKCTLIPILALSEAALPGQSSVPGYSVLRNPTMPGLPNGSAALFIWIGIPYAAVSLRDLCSEVLERVGACIELR